MKAITAIVGKNEYQVEFDGSEFTNGKVNNEVFTLNWIKDGDYSYHLIHKNRSINVQLVELDHEKKTVQLEMNGHLQEVQLKDHFDELLEKMGLEDLASAGVSDLKAPMPGLVLNVNVSPGEEVKKGDPLLVLEAMKMENVLKSPVDATIKDIAVKKADSVEKNQLLINFEI